MIALGLCVNDRRGNLSDHCVGLDVSVHGDLAMSFEIDIEFSEPSESEVRLGYLKFSHAGKSTMVGNVHWNSYSMTTAELCKLLNYLAPSADVDCIEAWSSLFDIWNEGQPFTVAAFEHAENEEM